MARPGVNSAGSTQIEIPLPMIRQEVLDNEHVVLALHTVYETAKKSASSNMIVGYCGGVAINP